MNVDGPICSDKGFTGEVFSRLSKVHEMPYDPEFRALPGGKEVIILTEAVLAKMSTDQCQCYKLVKEGRLPKKMQEMMCGPLCHARWLTTGQ